jgi:hypothetical protein
MQSGEMRGMRPGRFRLLLKDRCLKLYLHGSQETRASVILSRVASGPMYVRPPFANVPLQVRDIAYASLSAYAWSDCLGDRWNVCSDHRHAPGDSGARYAVRSAPWRGGLLLAKVLAVAIPSGATTALLPIMDTMWMTTIGAGV